MQAYNKFPQHWEKKNQQGSYFQTNAHWMPRLLQQLTWDPNKQQAGHQNKMSVVQEQEWLPLRDSLAFLSQTSSENRQLETRSDKKTLQLGVWEC